VSGPDPKARLHEVAALMSRSMDILNEVSIDSSVPPHLRLRVLEFREALNDADGKAAQLGLEMPVPRGGA
jgi:uncharacterized protein (UPF0147 family)